jgi:heme oxygenase
MLNHLDERLDELRQKYRDTRDREFYFRFLEAQRLREIAVDEQIRREQSLKRSQRRTED